MPSRLGREARLVIGKQEAVVVRFRKISSPHRLPDEGGSRDASRKGDAMKGRVSLLSACWPAAAAFLLMFSSLVFAQRDVSARAHSEDELMNNPIVQSAARDLCVGSCLSADKVKAMWVTYENGEFGIVPWPHSFEYFQETWRGPIPDHAVALIHTVPLKASGRPSWLDHDLADGRQVSEIRLPVYALHHFGIWKVVPGSLIPVQVRGAAWNHEFAQQSRKLNAERARMKTQVAQAATK